MFVIFPDFSKNAPLSNWNASLSCKLLLNRLKKYILKNVYYILSYVSLSTKDVSLKIYFFIEMHLYKLEIYF